MASEAPIAEDWGLLKRFAFRCVFVYAILAVFLPDDAVSWISSHWLGMGGYAPKDTGSGDYLYAYLRLACRILLTAPLVIAWTALAQDQQGHPKLHDILRTFMRYSLAFIMFGYGLAKVIPLQFSPPDAYRLLQPLGEMSPMGLAWTFMGFSKAYQQFAGWAEVLGAVLLLFRHTTTLGSLVLVGVLSNVVMVNFCFDIPVKINSSHYLGMALFLLAPEAGRLASIFVLNRPAAAPVLRIPLGPPWLERLRLPAKALLLAWIAWTQIQGVRGAARQAAAEPQASMLQGIWEVRVQAEGGRTRPPLLGDPLRWRYLGFRSQSSAVKVAADGRRRFLELHLNPAKGRLLLKDAWAKKEGRFAFRKEAPDRLVLDGQWDRRPLRLELEPLKERQILLVKRGFHWVNEAPYNN